MAVTIKCIKHDTLTVLYGYINIIYYHKMPIET